jgi:hypothetical protein
VTITNHPPALSDIADQTIDEQTTFTLTVAASDPDLPQDQLTFSLLVNPPGMTIDPATGAINWPTSEATGPSINSVTVQVQDSFGATDQKSFKVIVREVNTAPTLAPIANARVRVGELLTFTNLAADTDIPANLLTFTLGPGAPNGATLTQTTPTNAVFRWRPASGQGPSTNLISIIVTDNGAPAMSATRTFTVVVRGTFVDLAVWWGRTNLMVGESATVPLYLNSTLDITAMSMTLLASEARITNLTFQTISSPEVTAISQQRIGPGAFALNLTLAPAQMIPGFRTIAQLGFTAPASQPSVIASVRLSQLLAQTAEGQTITNGSTADGRVIIVNQQPVLTMEAAGQGANMTLYGIPGLSYDIQSAPALSANPSWSLFETVTPSGRALALPLSPQQPELIYRAKQR